eukprot:141168-Hanusia_phi.AAC.1
MVFFRWKIHAREDDLGSYVEGARPRRHAWSAQTLEEGSTEVVRACANDFGRREKEEEAKLSVLIDSSESLILEGDQHNSRRLFQAGRNRGLWGRFSWWIKGKDGRGRESRLHHEEAGDSMETSADSANETEQEEVK